MLFHHLGPYHLARLRSASRRCRLTALEFSAVHSIYAWAPVAHVDGVERLTLFQDGDVDTKATSEARRRLFRALEQIDPAVIAIPGWSHPLAISALWWSVHTGRPVVLMSDSTEHDHPRVPWKEMIKRRIVRLCAAGLVAGEPQAEYLSKLGLGDRRIAHGYDVVDNAHFAAGAAAAKREVATRAGLRLPQRYFLAVCRFSHEKNLACLLEAYCTYRQQAALASWDLVLLGDGPRRAEVEQLIRRLGLGDCVLLPGFKQYDELPAYYGLAEAFVHVSARDTWGLVVNEAMAAGLPVIVSRRCGCVPNLVREGVNGFTVDPYAIDDLAGCMYRMAHGDVNRDAMGRASREIIADWSPERFADGLMQAVEVALGSPPSRRSWVDDVLLRALAYR